MLVDALPALLMGFWLGLCKALIMLELTGVI